MILKPEIKLAIVGTREFSGFSLVESSVKAFLSDCEEYDKMGRKWAAPKITEIVSGGARGVDRLAEQYADSIGVPCKVFEPKIVKGNVKLAMNARNQQIVNYADAMVAIRLPDQSPGTDDAIARMKAAGKPVVVFELRALYKETFNGDR